MQSQFLTLELFPKIGYDFFLKLSGEIAMASKRDQIKMKSEESSHYYYTTKNKTSTPNRIELKKYDPTLRRRVKYKETK
jgi:large subunit ribosomal protein L33